MNIMKLIIPEIRKNCMKYTMAFLKHQIVNYIHTSSASLRHVLAKYLTY